MLRWFRPPSIDNEFERVAFHSLHYAVLLLLVVLLTTAIVPFQETVPAMLVRLFGIIMAFGCYLLIQRRHFHLAGTIFLMGLWAFVTLSAVILNGIYNTVLFYYAVIILFANLMFNRPMVLLWTAIGILSSLAFAVGYMVGLYPLRSTVLFSQDQFLTNRFLVTTFVLGATGVLSSFASSTLRRALTRLQQQEETVQARNRELETLTHNLAASEHRYRLLFENASIMAAVYDSDGQILLINDAAAQATDKPRGALEGRNVREVYTPERAAVVARMNQQALAAGAAQIAESSIRLPTGKLLSVLRHVIPLPSSANIGSGKPEFLVLTTDITEQKRAGERQQELKAAQERLSFFTDFFRTVSHDIKTPLTVMETSLHLLTRATTATYRQEKIDQLTDQIHLLEAYIQDMLMISRLEQAPTFNLESVNLESLVADILQTLRPKVEEKAIQCTVQAAETGVVVGADKDQMQRALTNLIENAIHYTPPAGQIGIAITWHAGAAVITVSDTGIGIRAQDLPHIFEAFFRAPDAKTAVPSGSGLGLAIVKKIVDLHGGSITVTSQPQQGSRFVLTLPPPQPAEA